MPQTSGKFLLSPLKVAYDFLTVPEEAASRAYAFTTLRAYLFEELGIWPKARHVPTSFQPFDHQDVEEALSNIKTYAGGRDNIQLVESKEKMLVYHLLAMKGILYLRFGTRLHGEREQPEPARLQYCKIAKLAPKDGYEFRASPDIERFPEPAEVINELWGVPLPIRGADTVFFNGLKFASEGSLVLNVTGKPGTGKTSIALAFAAALAPMGTQTYYITADESEDDLQGRLTTLIPEFLRQLSVFRKPIESWFRAHHVSPTLFDAAAPASESSAEAILGKISEFRLEADSETRGLPVPCPLIVVLDGLQYFLMKNAVHRFVAACKDLGALVILTMAERRAELSDLDYLVDTVIDLEYRHTDDPKEKPSRMMLLRKTRHQLSRPGAHICHISGTEGFRISPQLPSQLDRRAFLKFGLPAQTKRIDMLNRPVPYDLVDTFDPRRPIRRFELDTDAPHYLDVYFRSQVLVHGKGSSGKAGFGLKFLLSPILAQDPPDASAPIDSPRILVASFLYPKDYYAKLENLIKRLMKHEYGEISLGRESSIEVLHFYPGYLNPEDFFMKVDKKLDQADLEGLPFNGVLLDGLHNVFLQFPRLSGNSMVWPMLYGMLRTRDLTVVTTQTTFSVSDEEDDRDSELEVGRARPFLHALVQGADFYFEVSPSRYPLRRDSDDDSVERKEFEIVTRSAISQPIPSSRLFWHRENLLIYTHRRQRPLEFS